MIEHKRHVMPGFETELRILNRIALALESFVTSCLSLLGATSFGPSHLFDGKNPRGGL